MRSIHLFMEILSKVTFQFLIQGKVVTLRSKSVTNYGSLDYRIPPELSVTAVLNELEIAISLITL